MFHFPPGTRQLLDVLDVDWPGPNNEEEARDNYAIHAALTDLENALYHQLSGAEYERGTWPSRPGLPDAMRAALADQRRGPCHVLPRSAWRAAVRQTGERGLVQAAAWPGPANSAEVS
jgi:hypothetical protein